MKHYNLKPHKLSNDVYSVDCFLGVNIRVVKVKNKQWKFEPFQNHPYLTALMRKYDKNLNEEKIYYKSLEEAINALEKSCNEFFKKQIEYYYY